MLFLLQIGGNTGLCVLDIGLYSRPHKGSEEGSCAFSILGRLQAQAGQASEHPGLTSQLTSCSHLELSYVPMSSDIP